MTRKRYVQVGIGGRSEMYTQALTETFREKTELAGLCDVNMGRVELARRRLAEKQLPVPPAYHADDFDRMLAEQKPDAVIVTTKDCAHDEYICRAMAAGCDAVTEKPLTIDAQRCNRIVETARRTGRSVRVTFNYRYAPPNSQVKEMLSGGVIGKVLSVDFGWMLDTGHGADYYRRWHRRKENSGGLIVHKATHHFDLVNWWTCSKPETVVAIGRRGYYLPETADALGLRGRTERCHTCPHAAGACKFALRLADKQGLKEMYLDQETHDGYFRDRCVFSPEIDIEDSMNLAVRYTNGMVMSYCLNSFMPWEGFRIMFNGDRGRLEYQICESGYVSGDGTPPGETVEHRSHIHVFPHFAQAYKVELHTSKGGHGGGDARLLKDIFDPDPEADPLGRAAGLGDGCCSILTGVAANLSMAKGSAPVRAIDLVPGAPEPNWAAR